jgi:4-hydroxyphenylpyruvate dioxygenase
MNLNEYVIDYIEIYTPMAKALAYWHARALGFTITAYAGPDTGHPGISSYVCRCGDVCLVLTSSYPMLELTVNNDINAFVSKHYCGLKRFALRVDNVEAVFRSSVGNGAFPLKYPHALQDKNGSLEEASVKLFEDNEIMFISRENYRGPFKPGFAEVPKGMNQGRPIFKSVDHIAAEVRINESNFWTKYLTNAIGTKLVQSIGTCEENRTGMILNINQSDDRGLTLVIAEPESYLHKSKVQKNIETFGPGVHHLAFATDNLIDTVGTLSERGVEFVNFPNSYYDLLRANSDLKAFDIDALQQHGILMDQEDDTYLLQKFIKPISDRPFFLYEIVERINGYNGFALKNINVLKRAEEMEIMKQ